MKYADQKYLSTFGKKYTKTKRMCYTCYFPMEPQQFAFPKHVLVEVKSSQKVEGRI